MITIDKFQTMLNSSNWQCKQYFEYMGEDENNAKIIQEEWDDEKVIIPCLWGYAYKTSTLNNIIINYGERWCYHQFDPNSLKVELADSFRWQVNGAIIIDKDNYILSHKKMCEIIDYINDQNDMCFSQIDYNELFLTLSIPGNCKT